MNNYDIQTKIDDYLLKRHQKSEAKKYFNKLLDSEYCQDKVKKALVEL